jgi:hypothetical protein
MSKPTDSGSGAAPKFAAKPISAYFGGASGTVIVDLSKKKPAKVVEADPDDGANRRREGLARARARSTRMRATLAPLPRSPSPQRR